MPNLKYKDFLKQKLRIRLLSFQPANWISKDCTGKLKTKKNLSTNISKKLKLEKLSSVKSYRTFITITKQKKHQNYQHEARRY